MTDPAMDSALDRLAPLERELLLLLGKGHTAKSIAVLKGLTERAVNERFRSARRKTGIGSSREIARLLVAQENRDDIIGVVETGAPVARLPRPDAAHVASPLRRWSLPVSAAFLLATAIFAQQTAVPPERPLPPAAAAMFAPRQPSPDLIALRAEVTAGPADPEWSPDAEAALSQAYRRVTGVSVDLDVTCSRALCEVLGVSPSGLSGEAIQSLIEAIQARALHESLAEADLENIVQSFSTSEPVTERGAASMVFAAYWRRLD